MRAGYDPELIENAKRKFAMLEAEGKLAGVPIPAPTLTRDKAEAKVLEWRDRTKMIAAHKDKHRCGPYWGTLPYGFDDKRL